MKVGERKTEYRIGRQPPGGKEMIGMLESLLAQRYIKLSEVERRLLGVLMRWLEVELRCPNCESWFRPGRPDQRFCSERCRKLYDRRVWGERKRIEKRGLISEGE